MGKKYTIAFLPISRLNDEEATWGHTNEYFFTYEEAMCRRIDLCRSNVDVYYTIVDISETIFHVELNY